MVIIITAHGSERLAVQAVKSGAYDYISKPFELDDLAWSSRTHSKPFSFVVRIAHFGGE